MFSTTVFKPYEKNYDVDSISFFLEVWEECAMEDCSVSA